MFLPTNWAGSQKIRFLRDSNAQETHCKTGVCIWYITEVPKLWAASPGGRVFCIKIYFKLNMEKHFKNPLLC
jgi:hypothetical protein